MLVLVCSNVDDISKRYLLNFVTCNYNAIINWNNFYDQPTDSDIGRYEEIRKLTAGPGEDYTTAEF